MRAKRWGVFFCNCRSTLEVDAARIESSAALVTVASQPEQEVQAFAEQVEQQEVEQVVVGCCCAERSVFETTLKGKTLRFLDLKGNCFSPHSDTAQAHAKAQKMIRAEMQASSIQAQHPVPVNPLLVRNRVVLYTEFPEGLEMVGLLKDLVEEGPERLTVCVAPEAQGLEDSPYWEQRAALIAVEGRLGSLRIIMEPDPLTNGGSQKRHALLADQLVVLTKHPPPGIKKRTGVHLLSSAEGELLEATAQQVRELVGQFHKPEHVSYNPAVCAGGDKTIETCGRCITFCPYDAISRDSENPFRMSVDHMACEGCGACVSACPTSALRFTEPSPQEIYARMSALLTSTKQEQATDSPPLLLFHCEEMGRKVLDTAGQVPLPYPASVLPVEVPCLRYVSESNMLAAFSLGAAGVGLLGCENCPNGERELLFEKYELSRTVLQRFDLGAERVRILTAEDGLEAEAVGALKQFASELNEAPLAPTWTTPRQTGNREILGEVLSGFIEQTGKQPGGVKLAPELPFAFAEVQDSGCTLCRSCANVCPTNAFKFNEEDSSLHFKHINCVGCGLCEQVCPENVITLRKELYLEKDALSYQMVAEDEMIACTQCQKPYINRKALETIEAKLFGIESLQNTFSGNRQNILRMCPDCRAVTAMLEVDQGWEP